MILWDWQRSVHWTVYVLVGMIFIFFQVYGALYMSSGFFLPAICCGKEDTKSIALTFDDGPDADHTRKLLAILKKHQLEGCFFCIGDRISNHPDIVKQMHNEGHIIGNHSFRHQWNFDFLSSKNMHEELFHTDDAIETVIGVRPRFFRPPYGVTNPNLARAVGNDYRVIGWSVRSFDTVIKDPEKLLKRVTKKLKAGDIVLFHDHCEVMLQILPDFIKHVESTGLKIVRLDKLIGESPYTTS